MVCGPPMSIRGIEIHYESGPIPLIWTIKVEQEYSGYKAPTVFGGDMRAVNGKREKVCLWFQSFLCKNWNFDLKCEFVTWHVYFQTCTCLYTYYEILLLQFLLEPYEFLTQVEGYYGVNYRRLDGVLIQALSAIMFHTNLKKVHGPYGGGEEPKFTHFQSSVGKIVGFSGYTGSVVDQLGVFMSHDL